MQESLFSWLEPETTSATPVETPELEQKTAPPPEQPTAEEAPDLSHVWIVAAEVEVTPKIASVAAYRGSFKAAEGLRVDALEVYCKAAAARTTRSRARTAPPRSTTRI
ncbi:hypothetical protein AB0D12_33805 [Streptomyces sp. NPDC048479]|uniref:hypothetical protein n=1 Tax=Streptomyces sp. NPDC048479 TaxID=3154725 RepID=UPI003446E05C